MDNKKLFMVAQLGALVAANYAVFQFFGGAALAARPASPAPAAATTAAVTQAAPQPDEKRLGNIRQLTNGGENAEAYWSYGGDHLIFQSSRDGRKADQIYIMRADGSDPRMVSTGKGRTTCAYFLKDDQRILYASTHLGGDEPPPSPDFSQGYVWPIYDTYDIFTAKPDGSDLKRITTTDGYDAEATVAPDGETIVFTSIRDGDLDLYTMKSDGSQVRRLTDELGYDGGAFFSPDGEWICYRAHHPKSDADCESYRALLKQGLVRPSKMELFIMRKDGTDRRQVTSNGAANFCPYFTPDGARLIFASNKDDAAGRNFDLYTVKLDGTGWEQITHDPTFDGFPMFSPDGKKLVWASNRNARERGETNLFVADWIP